MSSQSSGFKCVAAVAGELASGKGEVGKFLASLGYVSMTMSAPMRIVAEREVGKDYTRDDLVRIADRERGIHGSGYWAGELLTLAEERGNTLLCIDGIRNPGELYELANRAGNKLITAGLTAPYTQRYERWKARQQSGDNISFDAFVERDYVDHGFGQPSHGQKLALCLAMIELENPANMFHNEGSLEQLHQWVRSWHERESARCAA